MPQKTALAIVEKRRPGRPPGSGKKPKIAATDGRVKRPRLRLVATRATPRPRDPSKTPGYRLVRRITERAVEENLPFEEVARRLHITADLWNAVFTGEISIQRLDFKVADDIAEFLQIAKVTVLQLADILDGSSFEPRGQTSIDNFKLVGADIRRDVVWCGFAPSQEQWDRAIEKGNKFAIFAAQLYDNQSRTRRLPVVDLQVFPLAAFRTPKAGRRAKSRG